MNPFVPFDGISFKKCFVRILLFNVLKAPQILRLVTENKLPQSHITRAKRQGINALRELAYVYISEHILYRNISEIMSTSKLSRLTVQEIQEFMESILIYDIRDLVRLYLHMDPYHREMIKTSFDEGDYSNISKAYIVELLLMKLYTLPRHKALTLIENNLRAYRTRECPM